MTTKTDQTSKEFKAKSVIDQPNRSIVMAALFGTALILVALIVFTALNGRVGTISQAANVQNSTDSIVTLGEIHALESGYNPRGVTEAEADSIVSLGMTHALESGYNPDVQADNIITLDRWYALENGASLEAVIGSDPAAQPADSILSLPLLHALESGYTPNDSIINLGMVHALESGYNPGE